MDDFDSNQSNSNCYYSYYQQDSDLSHFMELIENALNNSNLNDLQNIFNNYLQIDCSTLNRSNERVFGRQFILQRYQVMLGKISFFTFQFKKKESYERLKVIEEYCVGNIFPSNLSHHEDVEKLWYSFDMLNFKSQNDRLAYRDQFYQILVNNNMPLVFNLQVELYLVMNEDKTFIDNVMWDVVSLDFSEVLF